MTDFSGLKASRVFMGLESLCRLLVVPLSNWLPDCGVLSARDEISCVSLSLSNTKSEKTANSLHPLPPPVPSIYIQNTWFCLFNFSNNAYCQIQVLFLKLHLSFIKLKGTRKYDFLAMNLKAFPVLG